jgi:hypothetical protein
MVSNELFSSSQVHLKFFGSKLILGQSLGALPSLPNTPSCRGAYRSFNFTFIRHGGLRKVTCRPSTCVTFVNLFNNTSFAV